MSSCTYCTRTECRPGQYCPSNYAVAVACPAGNFCPNLYTATLCPAGYYCREGSSKPTDCGLFANCLEGSSVPLDFTLFAIMITTILVWYIGYTVYFNFRDGRRAIRDNNRTLLEEEIKLIKAELTNNKDKKGKEKTRDRKLTLEGMQVSMLRKSRNLNLGFRDLTVTIKEPGKPDKTIIDGVSGDIRAGRLTAIMGPSGKC